MYNDVILYKITAVIASLFAAMIAFGLFGDRRNHGMAYWAILAVVTLATCGSAAAGWARH
jgi:hypothetical protein